MSTFAIEACFREIVEEKGFRHTEAKNKKINVWIPANIYSEHDILDLYAHFNDSESVDEAKMPPADRLCRFIDFLKYDLLDSLCCDCSDRLEGNYTVGQIKDVVKETFEFRCEENILHQKFRVNIGIDTGDANWEYTMNTVDPSYMSYVNDDPGKLQDEASTLWLTKQQGHRKGELLYALRNITKRNASELITNPFLFSAAYEVWHELSGLNQLFFLVSMTIEEVLVLNSLRKWSDTTGKWAGYIILDSKTTCGFADTDQGSTSLLGIKLEKDVKLPIKYIVVSDLDYTGSFHYSIDGVITNRDAWLPGKIKHWTAPKKFRSSMKEWGISPDFFDRFRVDSD